MKNFPSCAVVAVLLIYTKKECKAGIVRIDEYWSGLKGSRGLIFGLDIFHSIYFRAYITMWYSKHSMSEKFDLDTHLSLLMTYIFKTILLILKRTFKKGEFFYDQNLPSLNTSSMKFLSFVILKVYFSHFYARLILKITFYEYGRGYVY